MRLILDNLPITTYDLELDPESGKHPHYLSFPPPPLQTHTHHHIAACVDTRTTNLAWQNVIPPQPHLTLSTPSASPTPYPSHPTRPFPAAPAVRPGFEVGYFDDKKFYVNNHLMFKILVHESDGSFGRSSQEMAQAEAAAAVEVCVWGWGLGRGRHRGTVR